jgi:IclR family pca regulon transcriptional regulator
MARSQHRERTTRDGASEADGQASRGGYFLQSLERHLGFLEAFVGGPLSLRAAAAEAGMELTSAFRSAHTFEALGYLTRDPDTRRYQLGPKARDLGLAYLETLDVRVISLPYMQRLAAESGEAVSLGALSGWSAIVIERVETRQAVQVRGRVGWAFPLHGASMGKVLAAYSSDEERQSLLQQGGLAKTGPNTITNPKTLVKELDRVKELGYAVNDEESAPGIRSVAVPIFDRSGVIAAALTLTAPSSRVTIDLLVDQFVPRIRDAAAAISDALGYRPSVAV